MRIAKLILVLLVTTGTALAQPANTAAHIRWGASLPANCSPNSGDVFFLISAGPVGLFEFCSDPNTWSTASGSITAGTGLVCVGGTCSIDTAIVQTNANDQLDEVRKCAANSATAMVCALNPTLSAYTKTWATGSGLTNIVVATNVGTVTTGTAHGMTVGRRVIITGATVDTDLNATYTIASVPTTTSFTIATSSVADGTYTDAGLKVRSVLGARLLIANQTTCTGTPPTLNVDTLGAINYYASDGTSNGACTANVPFEVVYDATLNSGTGGVRQIGSSGTGGVSTILYPWRGMAQAGVSGWNISYDALTNITAGTVDSTHIFPTWVVTANTSASALRQYVTVNKSVTSVTFSLAVASAGAASGSMGLGYACVGNGDAYDNPSATALTAITLSSLTTTKKVYSSTQAVTCDGSTLPKTLVIWWTATAPSDATLILLDGGVTL